MNYCDSCVFWDYTYDSAFEKMGTCGNGDLADKLAITEDTDMDEGTLFTAGTFGCVYHKKNGATKAVTEIKIKK